MIEFRDFDINDFKDFKIQKSQKYFEKYIKDPEYAKYVKTMHISKTILLDGVVIMCFGIAEITDFRAQFWGFISDIKEIPTSGKPKRLEVFRIVSKFLSEVKYGRIESIVHSKHNEGHRLLKMLNFKCETPWGMKNYFKDSDAHSYVRVK